MQKKHFSHIEEFEKNQVWFQTHSPQILKGYKNLFVAVWHQQIIDKDKIPENLSERVHKKLKDSKGVYVQYVTDKPMEMIL